MNEQIKQLMSQTLDDKFSHTWTTMTYEDLAKFSEKFAELIVKECALTAGLMEHEGRRGIGAQILDNFGVEE